LYGGALPDIIYSRVKVLQSSEAGVKMSYTAAACASIPSDTTTQTTVETSSSSETQQVGPTLRLVLRKPKKAKKVAWTETTVDNEHMNKRKSKCCCIYKKPHVFGESSSESDDDDCENCHGHVELRGNDNPPPPPPTAPVS
jgi:hypothetical protein